MSRRLWAAPRVVVLRLFEVPGSLADQHRQELTVFTTNADIGADATYFSALTYQELFARMVPLSAKTTRNTSRICGSATWATQSFNPLGKWWVRK